IVEWLRAFADAGVDYFICRFGSLDQFGQVERLARDILPSFETTAIGTRT
ncbi:MAG: Luciferase-like, subgroup, partial [Thermomicrobiales bacterium]|nr:Luciferase-like, subgroup [Thermomicrobiales bacterium]